MTKNEFLEILRKELKQNNVKDIEDILADYIEHFENKQDEGYTEEEITKKLGNPKEIASEYIFDIEKKDKKNKYLVGLGITMSSVMFTFLYAFMCGAVLLLGAASLALTVLGFSFITTINIGGVIPYIPYFPALMIGLALFALALLCAVGTIYTYLYVKHWGKSYINWCKYSYRQERHVATSLHPKISKKLTSKLKLITMISLIIFVATFAIGYIAMCIMTNSFEPWHAWNWFV